MLKFSRPTIDDNARRYLSECLESGQLGGDGPFTARCHAWLKSQLGVPALLTHSCTAALEMAALLANVGPGDEIIMPSYTFVSTANAFVLRGATPVFVDIRRDTLNLDENLVESALTKRTKAIVPVHYAGVACEMDSILEIASTKGLVVIEDAAQALLSTYKGRPLGTLGAMGCLSFHVSKNIVAGEGGALIMNEGAALFERAQILREKGTNRTAFLARETDRYEWLDLGSSFLPSDLLASLLLAQFEVAAQITARRLNIWRDYHEAFGAAEKQGLLLRPTVPTDCTINGHIYYVQLRTAEAARRFRAAMEAAGIPTHSHYVPLHSSPGGKRFGRSATTMANTDRAAETLIRLPIHADLSDADVQLITSIASEAAFTCSV